jgi:hypothetical protein
MEALGEMLERTWWERQAEALERHRAAKGVRQRLPAARQRPRLVLLVGGRVE